MKIAKPWKRNIKGKIVWYVEHRGKQIALGGDKKKAFAKYNELLKANEIGPGAESFAESDQATFHELVAAYEEWLKDNSPPSVLAANRYFFRDLKASVPASMPAVEYQPRHLEAYFKASPRIKSPSTKQKRIVILGGIYNWGISMGYVTTNPLGKMPKPTPRVRQTFVPPERIKELIDACPNQPMKDFVSVAIESGARAQEMFAFEAGHLQKSPDGSAFVFDIEDSKGNMRSRVVYLSAAALAIVERLAAQHPDGKLFRNTLGRAWTKDAINCAFAPLKEKLGMPGLCTTMLRHSYCHARIQAGQSPVFVAKLMGHTSSRMVETRYGHIENSKLLRDKANEFTLLGSNDPTPSVENEGPSPSPERASA